MEYVILGFLMFRVLSQYDLMKALKEEVSPFYKASLGSLQNGLKKLENSHHIEVSKTIKNGRKKNQYSITKSGEAYFKSFMLQDINKNKFEIETNTRLFFMGFMAVTERLHIVNNILEHLEKIINQYEEGEKEFRKRIWSTKMDVFVVYQFKTLSLGIHHYKSTLEWFKALKKELE